jgi:hypothetical protein
MWVRRTGPARGRRTGGHWAGIVHRDRPRAGRDLVRSAWNVPACFGRPGPYRLHRSVSRFLRFGASAAHCSGHCIRWTGAGLPADVADHNSVLGRLDERFHLQQALVEQFGGGPTRIVNGVLGAGAIVFNVLTSVIAVIVLTVYFLARSLPCFCASATAPESHHTSISTGLRATPCSTCSST